MLDVGIVVIGRNEGDRLKRSINSLVKGSKDIVYVDSGSSDSSVRFCNELGINVVQLDSSKSFSAARARNEGFSKLRSIHPDIEFVQFIDGDCEMFENWINAAQKELESNEKLAIVCGRRHEKHPGKSVFNLLCDIEWDTEVGLVNECGGDFMVRTNAFIQVNGFDPEIVAGEEPELCYRLRSNGWEIRRIDKSMTLHDANITQFSQWWIRTKRSGHSYAQNMLIHWRGRKNQNIRNVASILLWGCIIPLALFLSLFNDFKIPAAFLLLIFLLMILKITWHMSYRRKYDVRRAAIYAIFTMLGKIPESVGLIQYISSWLLSRKTVLIEYK